MRARRESDGRSVILKVLPDDALSMSQLASLRREHDLGKHLEAVDGVVRVLAFDDQASPPTVVFEDVGGSSLDRVGRLEPARVLRLAVALLRILVQVHRRGVVHKDIKPANLLVDPTLSRVWLIDFGIASLLDREEQLPVAIDRLEGTLAYMAPEQTGRVNRPVDRRADLYALGSTLYQLLTGAPPFKGADALELVHAHVALRAVPPDRIDPRIPSAVSDLVMRLLEKDVAARYQSAEGVLADLETCQRQLEETGSIPAFELGQHEAKDRFVLPQGLYGREAQLATLTEAFTLAATGRTSLACVYGFSGVGKTALIHELHGSVMERRGTFIEGKFDQFRRDLPYASLFQALDQLLARILGSAEATVIKRRERFAEALGEAGRLLTDMLPALELVIGPQPQVPTLGEDAARDRFQRVLQAFVRACATEQHPLVLFLDDMQWADQPSLDLLERLLLEDEGGHLLVIASYRDHEVTEGHPLAGMLSRVRAAWADDHDEGLFELHLGSLPQEALTRLVADTVNRPIGDAAPLASLIADKTAGNPFFVHQLLAKLHRDGHIRHTREQGWTWSLDDVRRVDITDNVVELLVGRIEALSTRTRALLRVAACVGGSFHLHLVAVLVGIDPLQAAKDLWPALEQGLILPLDAAYRSASSEGGGNARYRFQHDRVHQAAYSLVAEDQRPALHLQAGLSQLSSAEAGGTVDADLFDIADQLVTGVQLVADWADRRRIAPVLARAGRKARNAAAFAPAARYLRGARALLGDRLWTEHYDDGQPLLVNLMACEWMSGQQDAAEALFAEVISHSRTPLEKAAAYQVLIDLYVAQARHTEALDRAIEALGMLGERVSRAPGMSGLLVELSRLKIDLIGKKPEDLPSLPLCDDPRISRIDELIIRAMGPAFFTDTNLYSVLTMRLCRHSLKHGLTDTAAYAWAQYGIICGPVLGDNAAAIAWARASQALLERLPNPSLRAKMPLSTWGLVFHWGQHPALSIPPLEAGVKSIVETGDPINAAWCSNTILYLRIQMGLPFDVLEEECRRYYDFGRRNQVAEAPETFVVAQRMIAALRGGTQGPASFAVEGVDEAAWVDELRGYQLTIPIHLYWVCKLATCWLLGLYDNGLAACQELVAYKGATPGVGYLPLHPFFEGLCHAMLATGSTSSHRKAVAVARKTLAGWAKVNPDSFNHKVALLDAELARIDGDDGRATDRFEAAVNGAADQGFLHDQGVAALQAARHHQARDRGRFSRTYAREARTAFARWGATAVVERLEDEFPDLRKRSSELHATTGTNTSPTIPGVSTSSSMDAHTLVRSAQALSGEIVLPKLVERLLSLVLENAGARRAVLVLDQEGQLRVQGERHVEQVGTLPTGSKLSERSDLPKTVLQYVFRSGKPIVIGDVVKQRRFASDTYLRDHPTRALLCSPVIHHGEVRGVVYLENDLAPDVFTRDRLELLRVLCSQLVISIDNAELYRKVERQALSFARFVPREFLAFLRKASIMDVELGDAVEEEMTILFTDIRSFTSLSEQMSPDDNFRFINSYLQRLGPVIREHGGFIDKYVGDAIMALFPGTPDDALRAVLAMRARLAELNEERAEVGQPPIQAGYGLHTGRLMLGIVGEAERLDSTVISDAVNLASRMEGLTKTHGVEVVISGGSVAALRVPADFKLRSLGQSQVKGKREPIDVYEVVGLAGTSRHDDAGQDDVAPADDAWI